MPKTPNADSVRLVDALEAIQERATYGFNSLSPLVMERALRDVIEMAARTLRTHIDGSDDA